IELTPKNVTKLTQIPLKNEGKIKKLNSFIIDDFVFVFSMERKLANLAIFNLQTQELIKNYEYNTADFGIVHKVVQNGVDKTNSFKPKPFFKSYFPQAIGSTYNAELYIGVNKTVNDVYIAQIGHVDKNTFRNANAGNFWWCYPAFELNYNAIGGNFSGGFNPAGASMMIFEAFAENKRKGNFFEIQLDSILEPTDEKSAATFDYFDLGTYHERLEEVFSLNKYFLIPLKTSVRFINFDKKNNSYAVYNLPELD
ncbi:MAG: hypothetical protein AAF617_17760, partial [Bacteroidota bacterium]